MEACFMRAIFKKLITVICGGRRKVQFNLNRICEDWIINFVLLTNALTSGDKTV